MGDMPTEPRFINATEAAKLYGVDAKTVRQWARDRKIPASRTPGGRWRFDHTVLTANLTPPQETP